MYNQVNNYFYMRKIVSLFVLFLCAMNMGFAQKKVLFDLSHGQCQGRSYLGDVVPDYQKMVEEKNAEFVINQDQPLAGKTLKGVDVILMLSPLQHDLQKNITTEEAEALVKFIKKGGTLLVFLDEESHRVHLKEYNINAVTVPFGIEYGYDVKVPGNCGAVSFVNEIFSDRYEVPYSGARSIKGGIPASVCMEDGHQHSSYVELKNGGKLFACAETMVALLMGGDPVERKAKAKWSQTGWFGKDSHKFMDELIGWALK